MRNYDEFYDFMQEYTDFYFDVCDNEKLKMDALESENLLEINEILSEYQIYVKRAELYEQKRLELFKKIGLEGKTFKEIVDMETGECHDELEDLFLDFKDAVSEAKEYNRRSLEIALSNMKSTGMVNHEALMESSCYDKNGLLSDSSCLERNLLDKKA